MEYKDYYKILGVPRDASKDQIKSAYRKMARKYHPDVSKEQEAEKRFKEVNEANEVLKDREKRAAYDALGNNWRAGQEFRPPPGGFRGGPGGFESGFGGGTGGFKREFSPEDIDQFSDFFSSIFGSGFRRERPQQRQRGMDQNTRIQISLEDAYQGTTKQIRLEDPRMRAEGGADSSRTLNVRIPAGVTQGQQIRLAGQGAAGPGGSGDLFLEVDFAPHAIYRAEGKDIHLTLPMAPWEAALGATVQVPTLGGPVSLRIPAGSQSNQRLRLKGRGLPGKTAGDAFVQLEIVSPPADSDKAKKAYRKLAEQFEDFNPRVKLGV
ncbi:MULTISPECIES: DnaJ C-terminal domain-containing protein [Thiorhodovibrio]|uniref:DnaJ C-terminal domain-containing protein n=1 Tax=Thiorhodovibrio TaxID=61593 RepID=UPI0019115095|nr:MULTISPECIES: DnaJ C-terminal domain-containing protein [Thiorhodovibrio]MBK5970498.1 cytochrome C biogenesis protein [Thiorhodovibrio winogradskyi]WPL12503.1 Curved DNA-binding protein [Thiorhodovibrio litoralis]